MPSPPALALAETSFCLVVACLEIRLSACSIRAQLRPDSFLECIARKGGAETHDAKLNCFAVVNKKLGSGFTYVVVDSCAASRKQQDVLRHMQRNMQQNLRSL